MRERILLVPSANSTEYMRMLTRYGTKTLGMRTMGGQRLLSMYL
jgi:hypothetical protein